MPTLDSCINDLFEPGNITTDPGTVTTPCFPGYELATDGTKIAIITTTPPPGTDLNQYIVAASFYTTGRVMMSPVCLLSPYRNSLSYTGRVGTFLVGTPVRGLTSAAIAVIVSDAPSVSSSGTLTISSLNGTFIDGEIIQGDATRTQAFADV